jgi:DNA transformation protein and related proteins
LHNFQGADVSRDFADHLIDLLSPWATAFARKMFGGFGLFRGDLMFSMVIDDTLYFKTGAANRADYENAASEPFAYQAKGRSVTLSYWRVPAEVVDDERMLCTWADKAYRAAIDAATAKKPPLRPETKAHPKRQVGAKGKKRKA